MALGQIPASVFGRTEMDCAGTVVKVGKNVNHMKIGDRVLALCSDSIYSTFPGLLAYKIPDNILTDYTNKNGK